MKHIGIFGGTFNPIHNSHLILAQTALEQFELDKVVFVPSKKPPHKRDMSLANDFDRINMVKLAIEDNPLFEISTIEFERNGLSFTADSLMIFTEKYVGDELYFLLGEDSLNEIDSWSRPEIIFKLAHILVAGRNDNISSNILEKANYLKKKYNGKIDFINMPNIDISSSAIRKAVEEDRSIKYYLPENVASYIKNNNLYR